MGWYVELQARARSEQQKSEKGVDLWRTVLDYPKAVRSGADEGWLECG